MKIPVYLDNNATTPLDPDVLKEMMPYLTDKFGNAASVSHIYGHEAAEAVKFARKRVAELINSNPEEIIFTGGATESINLAIKGYAEANFEKGNHIITSLIEHKAVLDTCKYLRKHGFEISYLKVDEYGIIDQEDLKNSITDKTILVSVMTANNEIGTIQPVEEIGKICSSRNIVFHTDASQALGKIPIDVKRMNIDLMSITAHKMYGPKGVGALYVASKSPKLNLAEQMHGGGHERGFRSGTLNVSGIVGFGKACRISKNIITEESKKLTNFRNKILKNFVTNIEGCSLNGHPEKRLPNNLNVSFGFTDSQRILLSLKELAISTGSACSSETLEPSYVLRAIGKPDNLCKSSVRFGLGRFNTEEEIDFAIDITIGKLNNIRKELK
ncbi:MAG TPA: IscS subfamily cysteine desulfurase [Ignavibacteria bacterium]